MKATSSTGRRRYYPVLNSWETMKQQWLPQLLLAAGGRCATIVAQTSGGQRSSGSRTGRPRLDKETWVKMKILRLPYRTVKLPTYSAMLPKLSREFWRLYQRKRFFGSQGNCCCLSATVTEARVKVELFRSHYINNEDERLFLRFSSSQSRVVRSHTSANNCFSCPLPCAVLSVCRLWRNCGRRVLRTQQRLTFVSASGPSKTEVHVLCNILAEDLEVESELAGRKLTFKLDLWALLVYAFVFWDEDVVEVLKHICSLITFRKCFSCPKRSWPWWTVTPSMDVPTV